MHLRLRLLFFPAKIPILRDFFNVHKTCFYPHIDLLSEARQKEGLDGDERVVLATVEEAFKTS
jgi:hypothetical protein